MTTAEQKQSDQTPAGPDSGHGGGPGRLIAIPVIAAILLALFAWPQANLEPRGLPVGLVGPEEATAPIEAQIAESPDAMDIHRFANADEAREAIEDREVYGAFVATPAGPKVLTASAASAPVSQLLTHAAAEAKAPVEDVVSASPATAGLASSVLPLVLAGIVTGLAGAALGTTAARRAGLIVAGSVLAGLTATAIIQSWLDVIGGDWAANAAAFGLTVLAIGAFVAGSYALLGVKGAGVAAALMVFIGNPFSGVASAPELLPQPVGLIGQLMPPGAGGNLVRSTGYFDGAAAGGHVAVLAGWALAGMALLVVAGLRRRRPATAASAVPA
jgi:hypothetical protein